MKSTYNMHEFVRVSKGYTFASRVHSRVSKMNKTIFYYTGYFVENIINRNFQFIVPVL